MPRPCVRTLPSRCEFPSSRPLPSARLVTFGGVIGTMSRSDSRPRLDGALRSAPVPHPRRRPSRRLRSGLLGPDNGPSCVRRPSTPVERHRLASRRRTSCLRLREQPRPPRHSSFRGSLPAPHTTPVYASNLTSPPGPQDSVPTCPLRRWSDGTSTRMSSSVSPAHSHLMWKMERRSSRLHYRVQSLDDLVSAQQQRLRDRQPERLRRLQIDDQLELRRLLNR